VRYAPTARRFPDPLSILLLAAGCAFVWVRGLKFNFLLDDAFISLRYARNLFDGHGLLFNPGETPVEGYTNFLWVLIEAAHFRFTPYPEHWLLLYNKLAALAVVAVVWWELYVRGAEARRWLWLGIVLAAGHETLHAWMGGGLETNFFTFLVALAVGRFLREEFHAAQTPAARSFIPMGLALLTRPEAYLLGAILGAALVARRLLRSAGAPGGWRRVWVWAGGCALFALPHLLFRIAYYHDIVPNTFYAKVSGPYFSLGVKYMALFLNANYCGWIAVATLLAAAAASPWLHPRGAFSGEAQVLALLSGSFLLYVMYVGGDHFEFRLLSPVIPLFALMIPLTFAGLAARAESVFGPGGRRPAMAALAVTGILLGARVVQTAFTFSFEGPLFKLKVAPVRGHMRVDLAEKWRAAGEWLREFGQPSERIATPASGVIPYVCRLPTFDTHGLSDRVIGRQRIAKRGILAHEKNATWDDIIARDVTYNLDDLDFRSRPEDFAESRRGEPARLFVRLLDGTWMGFSTPGDAVRLRKTLRERGAIVATGPGEDARDADVQNQRNLTTFDTLMRRTAEEKSRRLESSFFRIYGT
jgi:arabinofuranosyltransferase